MLCLIFKYLNDLAALQINARIIIFHLLSCLKISIMNDYEGNHIESCNGY